VSAATSVHGVEAMCSCLHGEHAVAWEVEALDTEAALALLPAWVARRTEAMAMRRVPTP
jgi:hypothetical protein